MWDLHIHTPASYNFTGGRFATLTAVEKSVAATQIITNIDESDAAVYTINDYRTFDRYLELRRAQETGETIKKTVFPAIELRIESASKHRQNIHVVLSDNLTIQPFNDFKGQLRLKGIDSPLSDETLIEYAKPLDGAKAKTHGAQEGCHAGSLESEFTNKAVRRILEGGDEAVLKRELFSWIIGIWSSSCVLRLSTANDIHVYSSFTAKLGLEFLGLPSYL